MNEGRASEFRPSKEIWNNREDYLGKLVKYKFMTTGIKDLPRHPVFVGFRSEDDMS